MYEKDHTPEIMGVQSSASLFFLELSRKNPKKFPNKDFVHMQTIHDGEKYVVTIRGLFKLKKEEIFQENLNLDFNGEKIVLPVEIVVKKVSEKELKILKEESARDFEKEALEEHSRFEADDSKNFIFTLKAVSIAVAVSILLWLVLRFL